MNECTHSDEYYREAAAGILEIIAYMIEKDD